MSMRQSGVESVLDTLTVTYERRLAQEAALAELQGLVAELRLRAVRSGSGHVDLTLDDLTARIEQVERLQP